jgi:hypothetical protein
MIVENPKLDATPYAQQYELLRAQVISSAGTGTRDTAGQTRGIGLALLLSEGMPGWLKTVEPVLRASFVSGASDSPHPSLHAVPLQNSAVSLSCVQRHEVTALLASLVLSTRSIAHPALREGYR